MNLLGLYELQTEFCRLFGAHTVLLLTILFLVVYPLGDGDGKSQMTRHITNRAPSRFRLLYISTGEQTLRQIMQKAGKAIRRWQEARLVDIEAGAGKGMGAGKTPMNTSGIF